MNIRGYTYEADTHCIACAAQRFGNGIDQAADKEGNLVQPFFDTDEWDHEPLSCGTCTEVIECTR